jgi:type IV fimbrial biogenesis protein FimT
MKHSNHTLRQRQRLRRTRGMTMIELAVVMVILALLLVGAGPSMSAWMRNTQVRNTASSILAGLNRARNEAMRRNQPVRFSLVSLAGDATKMDSNCAVSSTGVSWVVSVRNPSSNCQLAPVTTLDPAVYAAAVADANNPLIVESSAGGVGGQTMAVAGKVAGGGATANTVTFNAFGRVADPTPMAYICVANAGGGSGYRRLAIEIGSGGTTRMCDLDVASTTDSRHCLTAPTC